MNKDKFYDAVIVGVGEIGRPLYELLNAVYKTLPIDPIHYPGNTDIQVSTGFLHVCVPGNLDNFDDLVLGYINTYKPSVVFIHSTVVPGTTNRLKEKTNTIVVNSPVHGKHKDSQMKSDMLRYTKYIGSPVILNKETIILIVNHLKNAGFSDVKFLENSYSTEWLKVLSTTYFGLVIAWAQEVERICDEFGLNYNDVTDFFKHQEDITPPHYAGIIGGHCILPNIEIIRSIYDSELLNWIEKSNEEKKNKLGSK
jgi:UDP-glucose 6-dehydrogenase